ncbi:MAG: hypothetical protein LBK18_01740 [Prevotellaceae bacterium]|jgi:hypothetical protein|nr:hypothetical protein [Prevotellaceae bacterium]
MVNDKAESLLLRCAAPPPPNPQPAGAPPVAFTAAARWYEQKIQGKKDRKSRAVKRYACAISMAVARMLSVCKHSAIKYAAGKEKRYYFFHPTTEKILHTAFLLLHYYYSYKIVS